MQPVRPAPAPLHYDADVELALDTVFVDPKPGKPNDLFASYVPAVRDSWRALDRTYRKREPSRTSPTGEIIAKMTAVNDAFVAAGIGYRLRWGEGIIDTYRIDRIATYSAGGVPYKVFEIHALHATRATPLGLSADDSVIFLDRVDEIVDRELLPLVFDNGEYQTGPAEWRKTEPAQNVSRAFTDAVRGELAPLVGTSDRPAARAALVDLMAMTAGRHETQHVLDGSRKYTDLGIKALAGITAKSFVQIELTAYLSQIANDPITPHLALYISLHRSFLDKRSTEAYVGVVVVEGLARQLAIPQAGPVLNGDIIDRDRLAQVASEVMRRDGTELRAAATRLYVELLGSPVVPITDL